MKTLENFQAKAESAKHSAAVSLNAARDAYALLEAERKDEDFQLLQEAARQYQEKHSCSATQALIQIGKRAEYLKELAAGESTFLSARQALDTNPNQSLKPA